MDKHLKNSHWRCFVKKVFLKISQNLPKAPVSESLFWPATFLKKRLWHWCFPVNLVKFLRTLFLLNTSGRLLLHLHWFIFGKNNIDNIESPISNDICVELWKLQVDQQGPRKTVTSPKAKLKTLTDAYKKAKGNNKKTGRASVTCPLTII